MVIRALPRAQAPANGGGPFTSEWFDFFRDLRAFVTDNEGDVAQIDDILTRLTALEDETETFATINGLNSVQVTGSLESGLVQVQLQSDTDAPGNTYYYGTMTDGTKGWFTVAAALAVDAGELEKTVGADGVTSFGLADLADSGAGTFKLITRDVKGRLSGTVNGDSDDVSEGSTNLYYTDERARDAMAAALVAGANVTITVNDPGDTITIAAAGGSSSEPAAALIDPIMDFMGKPPTATAAVNGASYPWVAAAIATGGTIGPAIGSATAPGIWTLNCGTTTTGITSISLGTVNNIALSGGEMVIPFRFRVPTLAVGGQSFAITCGLRSSWIGAANERLEIAYDDTTNAGKVFLVAAQGGVVVTANGTTTVAANTWVSGKIVVNAAGTQADLYINNSGTPEATLSSGLPNQAMSLGSLIAKVSGTSARTIDLDYLDIRKTFTTPR